MLACPGTTTRPDPRANQLDPDRMSARAAAGRSPTAVRGRGRPRSRSPPPPPARHLSPLHQSPPIPADADEPATHARLSPDETRFRRLLAELRVQFGPTFHADHQSPGFSRSAATAALRALVGNSTQTEARRAGFRGQWPQAMRFRVAAALREVASRSDASRALVLQVLSPRSLAGLAWIGACGRSRAGQQL